MDCEFAYMKDKIPYVLCRKEPEPDRFDRKSVFHAACPHQEHCPKQNCHKLTAAWMSCFKLSQKPRDGAGVAFVAPTDEGTATKKTAQKATRKAKSDE